MSKSASWWKDMLTRREANHRTATTALAVAAAGGAVAASACDKSSDDQESDARELQENHGWNVGYDSESIIVAPVSETDSLGNTDWAARKTPEGLLAAVRPTDEAWRSHESPALYQALAQSSLADAIQPIHDEEMDRAYGIGQALGELVDASENPEQTLLIIDLPGKDAVAAAAGMASMVEPVFWMDNWPHPRGVVKSELSLASTVYYAAELEAAQEARQAIPRAKAIILDSNRLTPYRDAASEFDNRYMAELPSATEAAALGITKIMLVTASETAGEADDLNDTMVDYSKGMNVGQVHLDQFSVGGGDGKDGGERYYYGGQPDSHQHFYRHHLFFLYIPGRRYNMPAAGTHSGRARPTNYSPRPRQTMFSSRTAGTAASGVGRTRPTGFGRITHSTRGGAIANMRSGSYGRYSSGVSG